MKQKKKRLTLIDRILSLFRKAFMSGDNKEVISFVKAVNSNMRFGLGLIKLWSGKMKKGRFLKKGKVQSKSLSLARK